MTADDEHGGMVAECPQCNTQVEIPPSDLGVDAAAGADLLETPGTGDGDEAVETIGDEAVLFAEQMGIEVEQVEVEPRIPSAVAADDEVVEYVEYEDQGHDPRAAAALGFGEVDTSTSARAARARQSQAAAQRRNRHHFKKFAIPLMLIMSGLLMLIAVWSTIQLAGGVTGDRRQRAMLMMTSWPVILILMFGAWWFHRDIRRSEQG